MEEKIKVFEELKAFIGFGDEEVETLKGMKTLMEPIQGPITDTFYAQLEKREATASLIKGRVDSLKGTHANWFNSLFDGEYGQSYFEGRWRIGLAHVRVGLEPHWVEGVMTLIRTEAIVRLGSEVTDSNALAKMCKALIKILDLDLAVINLSYQEDRLERLTDFTGMKRALIENIIKIPKG